MSFKDAFKNAKSKKGKPAKGKKGKPAPKTKKPVEHDEEAMEGEAPAKGGKSGKRGLSLAISINAGKLGRKPKLPMEDGEEEVGAAVPALLGRKPRREEDEEEL